MPETNIKLLIIRRAPFHLPKGLSTGVKFALPDQIKSITDLPRGIECISIEYWLDGHERCRLRDLAMAVGIQAAFDDKPDQVLLRIIEVVHKRKDPTREPPPKGRRENNQNLEENKKPKLKRRARVNL